MTKLFSMRSLAFAGAAAFALTLVAAPQAEAADAASTKMTGSVNYYNGTIEVRLPDTGKPFSTTEDGVTMYYQNMKKQTTPNAKKYTSISLPVADEDEEDEKDGEYSASVNIANLLGKEANISLSATGQVEDAITIKLEAAPKVKVEYDAKNAMVKFKNGSDNAFGSDWITSGAAINADKSITTKYGVQYKTSVYDDWHDVYAYGDGSETQIQDLIKSIQPLGGTLYVRAAKYETVEQKKGDVTFKTDVQATPYSKEVKVKIPAKTKAPKVTLNLNAQKAFEVNLASKVEYKFKADDWNTDWADGKKAGWATLIGTPTFAKGSDLKVTDIVSGDAILTDVEMLVRTKATDKKAASTINVISLSRSAASPTTSAITVAYTDPAGKKKVTGASITISKDMQYSTDGSKWKTAKNGTINAKDKDTKFYLRVAGVKAGTKNGVTVPNKLPSMITTLELDRDAKTVKVAAFDYDAKGKVVSLGKDKTGTFGLAK